MSRTSLTLGRYLSRLFLVNFIIALTIILGVVMLFETVELMRRAAGRDNADFAVVLEMALFKLPEVGQQIFPFVVLITAMFTFWRLTRSNELVVTRAVGMSAWQFLAPIIATAFVLGILKVAAVNPLGALLLERYESLENQYLGGRSAIDISQAGLWLRQSGDDGETIIHGTDFDTTNLTLSPVTVIRLGQSFQFVERLDGEEARLENGAWIIPTAWRNAPETIAETVSDVSISTDIDLQRIEDSFASPETVSFWEMPDHIETMERLGFSSVRMQLAFRTLHAEPVLFAAMVLIGAAFSLRLPRRGGTVIMVSGGIVAGFVLFFVNDVIHALGASETIPVLLAAWAPALMTTLIGVAGMLYLEDG